MKIKQDYAPAHRETRQAMATYFGGDAAKIARGIAIAKAKLAQVKK